MNLQYVTLTGADNGIRPADLVAISKDYPIVEWGILFSQNKSAVPRYPSFDWVLDLLKATEPIADKVNLAAHLCGKWVDDALKGRGTFWDDQQMDRFQRYQLNLSQDRILSLPKATLLFDAILRDCKSWRCMVGGDYSRIDVDCDFFRKNRIYPLIDASGGRGICPDAWPAPYPCEDKSQWIHVGYAGGLSPDNLQDQLGKIEQVAGDHPIWIDMESGIRTGDNFDLKKCVLVLQTVMDWIGK